MEIPIIILNWNGWEDTLECLDALMKQTYQQFKVYLVDNGSTDGSQKILKEKYATHFQIELILNQENLGFTRGNNEILTTYILTNPVYKYVVLLNNDTVPLDDWLKNLVQSANDNQADLVSSKMVDYYEPIKMDNAGHMMLNTGEILPIGHGEPVDNYLKGFENMGASAGAALYATQMLRDIGVFDEHFNTGYEDAELGVRAAITGYKSWYEPTAVVYHKMGQSIKKIFDYDYSLKIQKHILYTYFKLMPISVIILMAPFWIFRFLVLLVISLLFLRFKYFKILFQSYKETLFNDFGVVKESRHTFVSGKRLIASSAILNRQTFFLWYDFKRFYKFFFRRESSAIDSYGKSQKTKQTHVD